MILSGRARVAALVPTCGQVVAVGQKARTEGQGAGIAVQPAAVIADHETTRAALARIEAPDQIAVMTGLGLEALARIGARENPGPATAPVVQIEGLRARKVRVEAITVEGKILQPLGVVHAGVDHKPRHHPAGNFR